MIDIHSHLIFGVDDGPATIEESIRMMHEAESMGIKTIIATPHTDGVSQNYGKVIENLNRIVEESADCDIEIRLGFEVFLSPLIPTSIKEQKFLTLNNSGFILIEFPFYDIPAYSNEVIYRLQLEGLTPVIAHPERNRCFMRDLELVKELLERECLLQVDSPSITGHFGNDIKRFAKKLILSDYVRHVASDAHRPGHYTGRHLRAYWNVVEWTGKENADRLFCENARVMLDRADINTHAV